MMMRVDITKEEFYTIKTAMAKGITGLPVEIVQEPNIIIFRQELRLMDSDKPLLGAEVAHEAFPGVVGRVIWSRYWVYR